MKIQYVISLLALLAFTACNSSETLINENLKISFNERGLKDIIHLESKQSQKIIYDNFLLILDKDTIHSEDLAMPYSEAERNSATFQFHYEDYEISVVYELKSDWEFISKQIFVSNPEESSFKIVEVNPWILTMEESAQEEIDVTGGKYGKIIRYSEDMSNFYLVQNPYTSYDYQNNTLNSSYPAQMIWESSDRAFPCDRACLGIVVRSGESFRNDILPEWKYEQNPDDFVAQGIQLDLEEINGITDCARSFLLVDPKESVKVHIGWCENDYQIDMATPEGRIEYKRIIDQAAAVGCEHVLYTPNHSTYGPLDQNRDAWGWENLLWLGLGQKVRKGEWVPGKDEIPEDIREMLDYAKNRGVKLMAYVYPSLPFMQNPDWTAWRTSIGEKPEHYLTVDTGLKSYQDWFVDMCIAFYEQTGISGYSFDHWWIAYEDESGLVSSKYQQWFGTRRILEELRRRAPEIIIDGRQQYHHFGTWTWLAGTYPHPMMSDEQPGSFNPFPDLSTDRISANRQRYVAHRLMVRDFTPIEILPGFITHQTQRSDANRVMRRDSYRTRDWDVTGWRYNIISTIATAPFNLVINYLPARDIEEFKNFSQVDKNFFNHWLDFADQNLEILRNLKPIIGQPMVGRCDGTAAINEDQGFIFLFNPNQETLPASFHINNSIGLKSGDRFIIKEIYPRDNEPIILSEKAVFTYNDLIDIEMASTSARVLEIEQISEDFDEKAWTMQASKARVEPIVLIRKLNNTETEYLYEISIPSSVKELLAQKKTDWPVEYTKDDLEAPWIDVSRLLLFISIADPYRESEPYTKDDIELTIDGNKTAVKEAYNGVYSYVKRTFLGFYIDISKLEADETHQVKLSLPKGLQKGQFQGIFVYN